VRRREFITILGGAAVAWPLAGRAQQTGKVYRVGLIITTSPASEMAGLDPIHPLVRSFVHALRALGYVEGQNLVLERRSAEGRFERFGEIAADLIRLGIDVIVVTNILVAKEMKRVTNTVPIVMAGSIDPVGAGVVAVVDREVQNQFQHPHDGIGGARRIGSLVSNPANVPALELADGLGPMDLGQRLQYAAVLGLCGRSLLSEDT
jgi:hypothetical protein